MCKRDKNIALLDGLYRIYPLFLEVEGDRKVEDQDSDFEFGQFFGTQFETNPWVAPRRLVESEVEVIRQPIGAFDLEYAL